MIFNEKHSIGKYTVIRPLGKGCFAETYLVKDNNLNRITVIKIFFDGKLDVLLKEAKIQTALSHEHITKVHSADLIPNVQIPLNSVKQLLDMYPSLIDNIKNAIVNNTVLFLNVLCIDMEYMSGGTLGKKMEVSFISVKDAINYIMKVLLALEYIHSKGYIHKDIKPDNILLNDYGVPKLSDFGLSDHISSITYNGYTTHLPPEYFSGTAPNISSDLYAVGMTLYRLINNYTNWSQILHDKNISEQDLKKGKIIEKVGFQPFIPDKLKYVVKKACNKNKLKRYASATEFRNALAKIFPSIAWIRLNEDSWICKDNTKTENISIEYLPRKKTYKLCIKRNNRIQNEHTKEFTIREDAINNMFSYIRESYK